MANIFKTTLKKDIIADIADNGKREVRFPITKFWATRFADEFNLDEKTFEFKTFDSLEFSSPSNKDTISETCVFNYVRTLVDGDEFVIEFVDIGKQDVVLEEVDNTNVETKPIVIIDGEEIEEIELDGSDVYDVEVESIFYEDVFDAIKQWFDDEKVLDTLYDSESVFATNAGQIIILPKGKVLGLNKSLPLNNDNEVRFIFDKEMKVYFSTSNEADDVDIFDTFKNQILENIAEIRKNNFLFIWKQYTGIFMEDDGSIYFGMKYTTKKTIGFDRRYNVQ